MEVVTVRLSKSMFSAEAVARASHRHTGKCFVSLRDDERSWLVELTSKQLGVSLEDAGRALENDALDELLRIQIRSQTVGVAEVLLSAALSHAGHPE
jgi:His-Xaa-Ser system protein HxsD